MEVLSHAGGDHVSKCVNTVAVLPKDLPYGDQAKREVEVKIWKELNDTADVVTAPRMALFTMNLTILQLT